MCVNVDVKNLLHLIIYRCFHKNRQNLLNFLKFTLLMNIDT